MTSSMDTMFGSFLCISLGYLLGRVRIGGVKLGNTAILLVSLVFGHFGLVVPGEFASIGLGIFLGSIGLITGSSFASNVRQNGGKLLLISLATCLIGGLAICLSARLFDLPIELALGLGAGGLSSTAMLGTVTGMTPSPLPAIGYGISYVFGVLGVVLFIQILPKIKQADIQEENAKLTLPERKKKGDKEPDHLVDIDPNGFFPVAIACIGGFLIGSIKVSVGQSAILSIGSGGGSLIAGIILAHFGHIGPVNFRIPKKKLGLIRDLGLAFFLVRAGTNAGSGFVEVVSQYGIKLFFIGLAITLITTSLSFILSYHILKLPLFAALGTTTGAMTNAPSLGVLLSVTGDSRVANFYAGTQPVATILLVLMPQIIASIFAS